ncbi:MAG TPA: cytochrome c oxidase assembly protein [Stellaceae bacterium]|nr:cytochrome c oxidase assembly protein [Stellaceae bacterium]
MAEPASASVPTASRERRRRRATALVAVSIVAVMVGMAFASVPLYRIFCGATGFGGTTRDATAAPDKIAAGWVTVDFNAQVAPGLDWEFRPLTQSVRVHPGAQTQIFYRAVNRTGETVTARAVDNVTPAKVGAYFDKLQCFCFKNQTLKPGETVDMGVTFFVDPQLLTDPATKEVQSITLSYTMFRAAGTAPRSASAAAPERPVN